MIQMKMKMRNILFAVFVIFIASKSVDGVTTEDYNYDDEYDYESSTQSLRSTEIRPKPNFTSHSTTGPPLHTTTLSPITFTKSSATTTTADEYDYDGDYDDYDDYEISSTSRPLDPTIEKTLKDLVDSGVQLYNRSVDLWNATSGLGRVHTVDSALREWLSLGRTFQTFIDIASLRISPLVVNSLYHLNISPVCTSAISSYITGLRGQKTWAMRMIDSSGRGFTPGLMEGTIADFGVYDECLGIEHFFDRNKSEDKVLRGKYCIVNWKLPLPRPMPRYEDLKLNTQLFNLTGSRIEGTFLEEGAKYAHIFYERSGRTGICIPHTCSHTDIKSAIDYMFSQSSISLGVSECETLEDQRTGPKYRLEALHITILAILGVIVLLVVCSTLFDTIMEYTKPQKGSDDELKKKPPSKTIETLTAFSLLKNGAELFGSSTNAPQKSHNIDAINGVRFLSMLLLIYQHTYMLPIREATSGSTKFMFIVREVWFQFTINGWFMVDTFFMIAAVLLATSTLRSLSASGGQISPLQLLLNRVLRLWPSLLLTLGIVFVLPRFSNGPLWHEYWDYQVDKCTKYWWSTIFFFNNWFSEPEICLQHTWYLSADIQLFIVGLMMIGIVFANHKVGLSGIFLTIVGTIIGIGVRTSVKHLPPTVNYNTPSERYVNLQATTIHTPTYIHLPPYCIGIFIGFVLWRKMKIQIRMIWVALLWSLAFGAMVWVNLATLPWNRGEPWTPASAAAYASLSRPIWSLAVGWVVFACATGYGGPVNAFLSWSLFRPLSTLSYSMYLLHFLVIWARCGYARERITFSHYSMACEFIVNALLSLVCAMIAYLCVESPLTRICRLHTSHLLDRVRVQVLPQRSKCEIEREFHTKMFSNILSPNIVIKDSLPSPHDNNESNNQHVHNASPTGLANHELVPEGHSHRGLNSRPSTSLKVYNYSNHHHQLESPFVGFHGENSIPNIRLGDSPNHSSSSNTSFLSGDSHLAYDQLTKVVPNNLKETTMNGVEISRL